jgi:hypothetical protein
VLERADPGIVARDAREAVRDERLGREIAAAQPGDRVGGAERVEGRGHATAILHPTRRRRSR